MICYYDFYIGNNDKISIPIETEDGGLVVNNDLITALKNNPDKVQEITQKLYEELGKSQTARSIKIEDLRKKGTLFGNTNVGFLRKLYPDVFPETISADILLVSNLRIGGASISGRVINSEGKEIFVVKNTEADIYRLANYLKLKEQIEAGAANFKDESGIIDEILKVTKKKNLSDLLLDFAQNESKYLDKFTEGNKSYYKILTDISRQLLNKPDLKTFNNLILDSIYPYLIAHDDWSYKNDSFIHTGLQKLDSKFLFNILNQYSPIEGIANLKAFQIKLQDQKFGEELFNSFKNLSPFFTFNFEKYKDGIIYAKSKPRTAQDQYGWTYDTLKSFDFKEVYRGFNIYAKNESGVTKYYATKGAITQNNFVSPAHESLEAIRLWTDNKVNNTKVVNHSLLQFMQGLDSKVVKTYDSLIVGSTVKVLGLQSPLKSSTSGFSKEEQRFTSLKGLGTVQDFMDYVETWNIEDSSKKEILTNIDTPEKITAFLYLAQEKLAGERTNNEELSKIISSIRNAEENPKYYYIDEQIGETNRYRVIETDLDLVENYRKGGKHVPTMKFLNTLVGTLQARIPGIAVHVETSNTINELFKGEIDTNTTRAFIRNGEIYLNSTLCKATDLLHEYTHLILGMLKANKNTRSNYENLLSKVISLQSTNSPDGKKIKAEIEKVQESYPNISEMDTYEEVFANLFSEYLIDGKDIQIFSASEKVLEKLTENIFETPINSPEQMQSFYMGSIDSVFSRFNKDIAKLLSQGDLKWEDSMQYRQLSNYISDQIAKKEIEEKCKS